MPDMPDPNEPSILDQFTAVSPSSIIITLVVVVLALVIGSLLLAIAIRLSAQLLKIGAIDFKNAAIAALIGNFIQFSFGLSIGMTMSMQNAQLASEGYGRTSYSVGASFTPLVLVHLAALGLLLNALIYSHILRVDDGVSRLMYRDSLILTAMAQAILAFCVWVLFMLFAFAASALLGGEMPH